MNTDTIIQGLGETNSILLATYGAYHTGSITQEQYEGFLRGLHLGASSPEEAKAYLHAHHDKNAPQSERLYRLGILAGLKCPPEVRDSLHLPKTEK